MDYYNVDNYANGKAVNYNGIDYTECIYESEVLKSEWNDGTKNFVKRWFFRVPVGYDGVVVHFLM